MVRSFGFFFSRRWIAFAVAVLLIAWATWWLGTWQFGRLDDRRASNAVIRANETLQPAPADEVLAGGVDDSEQWRQIVATGRYDASRTTIVRYRTSDDGESGVRVVVPLETAAGTLIAVDRGWMPAVDGNAPPTDAPAPPAGEVTVTGWARTDADGSSTSVETAAGGFTTRAISGDALGAAWGAATYPAFVVLETEDPTPATSLAPSSLPDLGEGPHFFYGLQWWFFGLLALSGFGYLAYDEWRRATGRAPAPADGPGGDSRLAGDGATPPRQVSERAARKAARRAAIEAGLAKARAEKAAAKRP